MAALQRYLEVSEDKKVDAISQLQLLATHLYDAGVPLRQIGAVTGHASLASLASYLNLEQRAAGDALLGFFAE